MAEWRWHYAVDTCGAKDDRPLETEIDIRKSSNQPLEMELELNFDGMWNLRNVNLFSRLFMEVAKIEFQSEKTNIEETYLMFKLTIFDSIFG